jgi:nucleoside-diphosphate-sugar epimerase
MNLISVIAVYAALSRELGLPFRFPGPESVYRALYQVTSADLLARATVWAGESPAAQNELFNVTNGDTSVLSVELRRRLRVNDLRRWLHVSLSEFH